MNDINSLSHEMELQISYRVCAKIPEKRYFTKRNDGKWERS